MWWIGGRQFVGGGRDRLLMLQRIQDDDFVGVGHDGSMVAIFGSLVFQVMRSLALSARFPGSGGWTWE